MKKTQNPLVSIIVRTKDRPKLLRNALRSIATQDYRPIEVVLVNDGGCEVDVRECKDILGDVILNYVRLEKNTGRAHAGNVGIENAKGEYMGFLDDDDSFYANHLSALLGVVKNCDCKVVYSDAHIACLDLCSQDGEIRVKNRELFSSKDFSYNELLMDNYIPLICIVFSKDIFENINGFDETFDLYEDWDMLIRIAEHYPFHHVRKVTAEYLQWSSALQIAQSPEFADKAREAHVRIVRKHGKKYTPNVIRELVQYKRALGGKENMVEYLQNAKADLERSLLEKDDTIKTLTNMREALEQKLGDKEDALKYLLNSKTSFECTTVDHLSGIKTSLDDTLREKEGMIEDLRGARAGLEQTLREKEGVIEDLRGARAGLEQTLREKEGVIEDLRGARAGLEQTLREKEGVIEDLQGARAGLEQTLREKEGVIEDLRGARAGLEQTLREKESAIEDLQGARAGLEQRLSEKEEALRDIFNSRGWRFLLVYYGLRDRLLPAKSRRRKKAEGVGGRVLSALAALRGLGAMNLKNPFARMKEPLPEKSGDVLVAVQAGKPSEDGRCKATSARAKEPRVENCGEDVINIVRQGNNGGRRCSVLVAGIYLANQENAVEHIVDRMKQSRYHTVSQKWVALFGDTTSEDVKTVTTFGSGEAVPKFVLLNKLLSGETLEKYDYVVVCDDDIWLPPDFLDAFLFLQERYDFAVAQPARTHNSYIDHPFVERFDGLRARRTRFVEIGPLVSLRRDTFSALLPFDESSYMGWGYDFVWPCIIEKMGLRMGIIDATPVDHSMRMPVKNYNYDEANKSQEVYLSKNPHLSKDEAFRILESYT